MKNLLKEYRYVFVTLSIILSYTIWCAYYFAQPSDIEIKHNKVTELRSEWKVLETEITTKRQELEELVTKKLQLEPEIRKAEKELLWKK